MDGLFKQHFRPSKPLDAYNSHFKPILNKVKTKSSTGRTPVWSLTVCLYCKEASVGSSRVQQLVQYLSSVQVSAVVACINSLCCVCSVQTSPLPNKQSTLRTSAVRERPPDHRRVSRHLLAESFLAELWRVSIDTKQFFIDPGLKNLGQDIYIDSVLIKLRKYYNVDAIH